MAKNSAKFGSACDNGFNAEFQNRRAASSDLKIGKNLVKKSTVRWADPKRLGLVR
jgi:hypothetical protein